jgi:hypothetical protein
MLPLATHLLGRLPLHLYPILSLVILRGIQQARVQPPIVGKQQQPLTVVVQPSDRVYIWRELPGG